MPDRLLRLCALSELRSETGHGVAHLLPGLTQEKKIDFGYVDSQIFERSDLSKVSNRYSKVEKEFPPVMMHYLKDCVLLENGIVICGDVIVQETAPAWLQRAGGTLGAIHHDGEGQWKLEEGLPVSAGHDGPCYAFARYAFHFYGHLLIEIIPRLLLAIDTIGAENIVVYLDQAYRKRPKGPLGKIVDTVLSKYHIPKHHRKLIPREGVQLKSLMLVEPLGGVGGFRPEIRYLLNRLADDLVGKSDEESATENLYLSRESAGSRNVSNEEEVLASLGSMGFRGIDPSSLSFEDQIRLFRKAGIITGPLGSAFANMVFSPAGCHVIGLIPDNWQDIFFASLSVICDQTWSEIRCNVPDENRKLYQRNAFEVDVRKVCNVLDRFAR